MSICLGAENCWFLAALEALTFHQDILAVVVPQNQSFERKYAGIFHFRVHLLPQRVGDLQKSSVTFCATPLDNLYTVPLGQWQVARAYPGLESSPSSLPQSSAGSGSTTSHWEDIPPLGPSLQLYPTRILIQTKVFVHSGNSQLDLSISALTFYPFSQLLMQFCYPAVRNIFPEA